jgi:hypothetical protein
MECRPVKAPIANFGPILGLLKLEGTQPFEIGFYHGQSKSDDANSYLNHFHIEIACLIENGKQQSPTTLIPFITNLMAMK